MSNGDKIGMETIGEKACAATKNANRGALHRFGRNQYSILQPSSALVYETVCTLVQVLFLKFKLITIGPLGYGTEIFA
jgi:hypothetical protein